MGGFSDLAPHLNSLRQCLKMMPRQPPSSVRIFRRPPTANFPTISAVVGVGLMQVLPSLRLHVGTGGSSLHLGEHLPGFGLFECSLQGGGIRRL